MQSTSVLKAAALASSLFVAMSANAGTVTLAPTANNGPALPTLGTTADFQATGATINLGSTTTPSVLTINSNTGSTTFSESGRIFLNAWTNQALFDPIFNPNATVPNSGLGTDYAFYIDFTLNGSGSWGSPQFNQFTADPLLGGSFTGTLFAVLASAPGTAYNFGTLSLIPDPTTNAQAVLQTVVPSGLAPGANGQAQTNFSAVLAFAPAAGTTGANGFFKAPDPFVININVGSVGGNVGNTTYVVDETGKVIISTPTAGTSPSTGNLTFTTVNRVPEPGSLVLTSLALIGLGLTAKRKSRKA